MPAIADDMAHFDGRRHIAWPRAASDRFVSAVAADVFAHSDVGAPK